jgi:thymidylate synthase
MIKQTYERYESLDERTKDIFENISNFITYNREQSGTGDAYKNSIAEITSVYSVITNSDKVILNNNIFKTPKLHSINEIFTQFFNLNPPFILRYKKSINDYYKLTILGHTEYVGGSRWNEFNQFDNIINILSDRLDSKRAVISIYMPYDTVNIRNDVPCALLYHFIVRNNKLNMFVAFRSHDLFAGYRTDYVLSSFVLHFLAKILSVVKGINIVPGEISVYETSLHYYPLRVKTPIHEVAKNFNNNNFIFRPFTDTDYKIVDEINNDLKYLKLSEEAAYSGAFDTSLEFINRIKDSELTDIAKYLYNLNIKIHKKDKYLEYTNKFYY